MRSLYFCASTVENLTAPKLAETTMYAPNILHLWNLPTRTTLQTPTIILAKIGYDHLIIFLPDFSPSSNLVLPIPLNFFVSLKLYPVIVRQI